MSVPRFVADAMLGRLAQWLRILGADCVYLRDAPDAELRRVAVEEDRILLTRDLSLAATLPDRSLVTRHQRYPAQLRELIARYPSLADPSRVFTRCVACNGALVDIPKADAGIDAPPEAYRLNDRFWRCRSCGRLFWRGSHYAGALRLLKEILSGSAAEAG